MSILSAILSCFVDGVDDYLSLDIINEHFCNKICHINCRGSTIILQRVDSHNCRPSVSFSFFINHIRLTLSLPVPHSNWASFSDGVDQDQTAQN